MTHRKFKNLAIGKTSISSTGSKKDVCEIIAIGDDVADIVSDPITETIKEQNAGRDLDALLDKISSIVDRSPKNSDNLENSDKPSDKSNAVSENQNTAAKAVGNQLEGKEEDVGAEKKKEKEKDYLATTEVIENSSVDTECELEADNKSEAKDIEVIGDPAQDERALESSTDAVEGKKEEESEPSREENSTSAVGEGEDKTSAKINTSDDVFEDALDNISSADEFEGVASQKSLKTKAKKAAKKPVDHDLEDISSDDDDILNDIKADKSKQLRKSSTDIIDLDSSDESTEVKESQIPIEDTDEKKEEDIGAEVVEAVEEPKATELQEAAYELVEESEPKAGEVEKDKVAREPEEAMWVDGEEPKLAAEEPDGKEEVTNRTETQEMNDTNIDDLLLEANSQGSGKEKNKNGEQNVDQGVPKVNGAHEEPSNVESNEKDEETEMANKETLKEVAKEPESDDEVIFFESIEKSKKAEAGDAPSGEKVEEPEAPKPVESNKDDEVVLVSEDEDEEPAVQKPIEESLKIPDKDAVPTEAPAKPTAEKSLQVDNSDNACDQFEKVKAPVKEKPACTENGNSNSSSNLLRPGEDVQEPASKRVRLSTDEKAPSDLEAASGEGIMAVPKRSHDHLDVEVDTNSKQPEEVPNKKLKTDDTDSNSSCEGNLQIDLDEHADKDQGKEEVKVQGETELVLDLKPEPEIKADVKPLKMEFVRNFRKSFDKMTRNDLEELVLQKVVEGMLVKSEFADLRSQLEKCENLLAAYRRKIAEVSKQFLDLDTVHKRVLKDLETKNSHFTAPVRITRAVGLQVGIPFKAMKPSVAAPEQPSTSSAGSGMLAPPSGTPPKASTSPMRLPARPRPPVPSPNTSPQHQQPEQQQRVNSFAGPSPTLSPPNAVAPVRRGCMQKVTPQRPVPSNVLPKPQINNQPNVHRLQPPSPQRALQASKSASNTASIAAAAAAKAAAMRQRNSAPNYMPQKQQQQQSPQYQP